MFVTALGGRRAGAALAFGSGIAFGVAFLMRPELAWGFLAVVAAWPMQGPSTGAGGNRARLVGVALAGFAITLAPLEIYTLRHFGRVMPAHLSANAGLLQASWVAERTHLLSTWLLPSGWTRSGPAHPETFWIAAPLILLAGVPARPDVVRGGRRFLWIVTALVIASVLLMAPNDGGGQWAPRYLLFAYVPLVVLAADAVETLPRRTATVAALIVLLLACLYSQRLSRSSQHEVHLRQGRGFRHHTGRVERIRRNRSLVARSGRRLGHVRSTARVCSRRRQWPRGDAAAESGGRADRDRDSQRDQSPTSRRGGRIPATWKSNSRNLEVRRLVAITLHHRCSQ